MAKLNKNKEILQELQRMVLKQASAEVQKSVVGEPNKDLHAVSVSPATDTVDKNKVGPEHLEQEYKQEASKDSAKPIKHASVAELGNEILAELKKGAAEEVQKTVSGEPDDVPKTSPSPATDTVAKNDVVPEKNTPQAFEQKPNKEEAAPSSGASTDSAKEAAEKLASYELGRQFAAALWQETKSATKIASANSDLIKAAGRRDLEALIAQAADTLTIDPNVAEAEKQAGAAYFDEIYKQACLESEAEKIAAENTALKTKLAEMECEKKKEEEAKAEVKKEEEKKAEAAKLDLLVSKTAAAVIEALKNAPAK